MTNLTYTKSGDYYIPNISIQETTKPIGRFGRMRRKYLQEENPILYNDLILTEKLFLHRGRCNCSTTIRCPNGTNEGAKKHNRRIETRESYTLGWRNE